MDKRILAACRLLMEVALSQMDGEEQTVAEAPADETINPQFDPETFEQLRQGEVMRAPSSQTAETAAEQPGKDRPESYSVERKADSPPAAPPVHAIHWHGATERPVAGQFPVDGLVQEDSMRAISDYFERDARRYGG